MTRTFTHRLATRDKTPILVGLVGPSGSGKTKSALRLADGFRRVTGGETFVIDTEAGRAKHYAKHHAFQHVPFGAPFGSLDYLDAINYCIANGATNIIVDSMSHEHEGPGGLLEQHAVEHKRLGGTNGTKMLAWNKPKSDRRRLINSILQMPCNFIFCFRAKEKLKIERGKDPVPLGFMPISGDEWIYEMTLKCLLLPGSDGVPIWKSEHLGEAATIKLPQQFRDTFAKSPQLSEDIGAELATWAAGEVATPLMSAPEMIEQFESCSEATAHRDLEYTRKAAWSKLSADEKKAVKSASTEAAERIDRASRFVVSEPPPADDEDFETKAAG